MDGRAIQTNLGHYLLEPGTDSVALLTGSGTAVTHEELGWNVAALAVRYVGDGLTKARVGLDLCPSIDAVVAYLALLVAGNTVVLARRIDQQPWQDYLASAELDGVVRAVGGRVDGTAFGDRVDYELDSVYAAGPPIDDLALLTPPSENAAVNLFTSGTTGRPKIVELSHGACIASSEAILQALPVKESTRTALILSLAHSFGMSVLHTHLRAGASLCLVERPEFVGDVLGAFTAGGCNALAGVPTQLRSVSTALRRSPELTLPVDLVMQAGGRLEVGDADDLLGVLPPDCRLYQMYGQTEAAARIAILDAADRKRAPASVGRPIAGTTVRIADDSGAPVPTGTEGEVLVCGPTVMTGYHDDVAATAEVIRDGWLHTGDFGYLDGEGFLYVTGRRSNFVKIDGERISLEAVESAALAACSSVTDALAQPRRDPEGRVCVAISVVLAGPTVDLGEVAKQVRLAVRRKLGKKAEPTVVESVDQVAYTPNGKKVRPLWRL